MKKKRVSSKILINSKPSGSQTINNLNDIVTRGLFTFPNGDKYEGEYRIYGEELHLVRQGQGIYYTDDFNIYEAVWERDRISDGLCIRFNNGMKYTGVLDNNGSMCGPGTYFFSDGSSISAIWNNNKPFSDIRYKEPLGFVWKGEIFEDGNTIRLTTGNHFWDDMSARRDKKSSEKK